MKSKIDKLDDLLEKIHDTVTEKDSVLVFIHDSEAGEAIGMLKSNNKNELLEAICRCMESGDSMGDNLMDMISSAVISFSRLHPEYATAFIQTFNRIVYGLDEFNIEAPN